MKWKHGRAWMGFAFVGLALGVGALEFGFNVSRGWVDGMKSLNKFGRATNVDTTATDVWDGANATTDDDIWNPLSAAQAIAVRSSSADDDGSPAGTGARTVVLVGLGSDWKDTSETVTLDGTTDVNTSKEFIRVFRMYVTAAGSGATNAGILIASGTVDGVTTAQINAGQGQTQMAIYTVPANYVGYLTHYYASINQGSPANARSNISLLTRDNADVATSLFVVKHTQAIQEDGSGYLRHQFDLPFRLSGKTDVKLQALGSANDCDVSGGFDMILVRNE